MYVVNHCFLKGFQGAKTTHLATYSAKEYVKDGRKLRKKLRPEAAAGACVCRIASNN